METKDVLLISNKIEKKVKMWTEEDEKIWTNQELFDFDEPKDVPSARAATN